MKEELKDLIGFWKQKLGVEVFSEIPVKPSFPVAVLEFLDTNTKLSKTNHYVRVLNLVLNLASKKYSELHDFEKKILEAVVLNNDTESAKYEFHDLKFVFKQEDNLFFLTVQMKVLVKV